MFSLRLKMCIFVGMKPLSSIAVFSVIVLSFFSCEEEAPLIRFIEKPLLDTAYQSAAPAAQAKTIWLADVTGVKCVNCPEAAEIAYQLYKDNPGRVEIIALFPTFSSLNSLISPWAGYDTLYTKLADDIMGAQPDALPRGLVDNIVYNGNRFIDRFSWPAVVQQQMNLTTPINLEVKANWIADENRGRIEYKATANAAYTKPILVIGAILEDKIIGKQSDRRVSSGYISDYEFNHVLRGVVGSTTGDTLAPAFPSSGYTVEKHYYLNKNDKWKVENLSVLIWILDAETREVMHCKSAKLAL